MFSIHTQGDIQQQHITVNKKYTTSTQQVHFSLVFSIHTQVIYNTSQFTTSTQQVHNKYTTSTQQVHNKYVKITHFLSDIFIGLDKQW